MLATTRLGIAYPQGTDTAVVPRDVQAVAQYIDSNVPIFGTGVLSARPAATVAGRFYYATDTGLVYFSTGSAWIPLNDTLTAVPVGVVLDFAGGTVPTNYMLAVGTAVSRATYAALFTQLGTKYGAGDGTATFNLPDYRGRVAVGQDRGRTPATGANDLGASGGAPTVQLTGPQSGIAAHGHAATAGVGYETNSGGTNLGIGAPRIPLTPSAAAPSNIKVALGFGVVPSHQGYDVDNLRLLDHAHAVTVVGAAATNAVSTHENMQPWLACDKIIKVL